MPQLPAQAQVGKMSRVCREALHCPPQQAEPGSFGLGWHESFIKHRLYAGHCARGFTDVTAFLSHNCPLRLSFCPRFSS